MAMAATPLRCSNQTLEQQLAVLRNLHKLEADANAKFFAENPEFFKAKEKRKKGQAAKEEAEKAAAAKQKAAAAAPEPVAAVVRPEVSLLERLKMFNLAAAQDLQARRPNGHSTHNLLVKDKKTKKLLLVSHRQQAQADLKAVAKATGCKELRLAAAGDVEAALGEAAGGCISVMSLWYNKDQTIQVVLDASIAEGNDDETLCICVGKPAGCNNAADHSQHQVVNIPIGALKTILKEVGNEVTPFEF